MRAHEFIVESNWYIRVNGKNQGEPYPSKDAAYIAAIKLSNRKRIPLQRIKLTASWMDAPADIKEGKLGPHAGKEVYMLIHGTKPAGLISPKEKEQLTGYINSGQLVAVRQPKSPSWIVAQSHEKWRIPKIYALLKQNDDDWEKFGPDEDKPRTLYHANLGRLLGYDEEDIAHLLNYREKKRQKREDERLARVAAWKKEHGDV